MVGEGEVSINRVRVLGISRDGGDSVPRQINHYSAVQLGGARPLTGWVMHYS